MQLDETQKRHVAGWIAEGLKLAEIQKRLDTQFSLRLTYLDVRLLVDELKLTPKDVEPPVTKELARTEPLKNAAVPQPTRAAGQEPTKAASDAVRESGAASVTVDTVTRPGALVSGKVKFSDGQTAEWFLDQLGRLGLAGTPPGYRPSPDDLQTFQMELQNELQKLGM